VNGLLKSLDYLLKENAKPRMVISNSSGNLCSSRQTTKDEKALINSLTSKEKRLQLYCGLF
tara:strand:+ start:22629 stop:22811 length:183 start_codon:yes stop_codon:yes gene_type:complete